MSKYESPIVLPQDAFESYVRANKTGSSSMAIAACLANIGAGGFGIADEILKSLDSEMAIKPPILPLLQQKLEDARLRVALEHTPTISVIIPYHNREFVIENCIRSVLNQTVVDLEIIAVDDGSTDRSRQIVDNINDCRLVKINRDYASGNSGTPRNIALDHARGQYIAFVDSDDTIDEEYFEELLQHAQKSNAEVVFSNSFNKVSIDQTGQTKQQRINYAFQNNFVSDGAKEYFFINSFVIWDKLYRRDFIERHNIRLADSKIGADTLMVARTYYHAESISLCRNKSNYNYNAFSEGSVTQAFRSKGDIWEEDKPYAETFAWMVRYNIPKAYVLIQWIRRLMSLSYCLSSSKVEMSSEAMNYLKVELKEAPFRSALTHLKKKGLNEQFQSLSKLLTMLGRDKIDV